MLLEHAYRVLDPMVNPADAELLGEIQGLVNSRMTTLGDILEYLPWGIVWEQRNQREDLAAQCARLRGWERALTAQLALLKKGEERFKNDKRYELWQRLQQGTAVWQAYLADAERKLHQEIADLEVRRNDRQATLVKLCGKPSKEREMAGHLLTDDLPVLRDDTLPARLDAGPECEDVRPAYRGWSTIANQRSVRGLDIDASGSAWLATAGGVLRWYPGMDRFSRYGSEHGLPGNSILAVVVDGTGIAWALAESGCLSYLEDEKWHRCQPLADVHITVLVRDDGGQVWAAGDGGLYVIAGPASVTSVPGWGTANLAPRALCIVGSAATGTEAWLSSAIGIHRVSAAGPEPPRPIRNVGSLACRARQPVAGYLLWAAAGDRRAGPRGDMRKMAARRSDRAGGRSRWSLGCNRGTSRLRYCHELDADTRPAAQAAHHSPGSRTKRSGFDRNDGRSGVRRVIRYSLASHRPAA